ncbi:MAG TPA: hypothetical protein DCY47_13010 [Candidatus Accumulibacter sp.]|nr:hypothetical protein [Accumulibacter sp.]
MDVVLNHRRDRDATCLQFISQFLWTLCAQRDGTGVLFLEPLSGGRIDEAAVVAAEHVAVAQQYRHAAWTRILMDIGD